MVNIALAQMTSVDSFEKNFDQIRDLVSEACKQSIKPEIIFFPENSLYFRMNSTEGLPKLVLSSDVVQGLQKLSADFNIKLHITSSLFDQGKNWNASFLIQPNTPIKIIYKKIHLFDISLLDEKPIKESDAFSPGVEVTDFQINDLKIGSSICYDLRFSELHHRHALNQVDAIVVPAAFLVKTGRAHWEVLLRARAIESQCYIIAPAQAGFHCSVKSTDQRETYGHSMLISPWGDIIAQKSDGIGLIYGQIDRQVCLTVRRQIPMMSHRVLR
jgi:deaminated glutathione amidase